eukprot:1826264-Pleurochrysis_carterae.AAC.2
MLRMCCGVELSEIIFRTFQLLASACIGIFDGLLLLKSSICPILFAQFLDGCPRWSWTGALPPALPHPALHFDESGVVSRSRDQVDTSSAQLVAPTVRPPLFRSRPRTLTEQVSALSTARVCAVYRTCLRCLR